MVKKKVKKKSPSQIRYREENPNVTFTLTKKRKDALDSHRGGLSYGEYMGKLMTEHIDEYIIPYQEGNDNGYEKGFGDGAQQYLYNGKKIAYEEMFGLLNIYNGDDYEYKDIVEGIREYIDRELDSFLGISTEPTKTKSADTVLKPVKKKKNWGRL